jgi:hypothetical protein
MAELSEVTTAMCLYFSRRQLRLIESSSKLSDLEAFLTSTKFQDKLKKIKYGSQADLSTAQIDLDPKQSASGKGWEKALSNTAQGVSGALGIKNWMRDYHNEPGDVPKQVFLTGDQWPREISKFRLKYAGMNDYNSSDLVVYAGKQNRYSYYYGISLKKKPKPQAASPPLINNAVSKVLETGAGMKFVEEVDSVRVSYLASLIRSKPFQELLVKNKIKSNPGHMRLSDAKLVMTKPTGQSKHYIDLKGKNNEIRDWVNYQIGGSKNIFFKELKKIFDSNSKRSQAMANILAERVLKISLNDALGGIETLNDYYFGYALVSAVGEVNMNKQTMSINAAEVKGGASVLCALNEINRSDPTHGYTFKYNKVESEKSNAAKIYFDLIRGNHKILDLQIRYKGGFTSWPQFLGVLSPEFEKLLKEGKCS